MKNKEPNFEYSEKIIDAIEEKKIDGVMSTIVLAEVLVGFYQNDESNEANRFTSNALLNFDLISVNPELAKMAAQIRAKHNIGLPDAMISASTNISNSDFFLSHDETLLKKLHIKKMTPKEFVEKFLIEKNNINKK